MNTRERARFDMLKRVGTFGTNNATDFDTPVPPAASLSPGQEQAKLIFADLSTANTGLIPRIETNAGEQASGTGEFRGGTTSKSVLRSALLLELRGINRTAAAIAAVQQKPDIMDRFRMPHGVSDAILAAKASAIADAIAPLLADFIAHGHEPTLADDLHAHIADMDRADNTQNTGQQGQAGATAQFGPLLEEAMVKVTQLDAFMHNFYKSNAEKLGEWHTASHVARQPKAKTTDKPKPTP